MRPNNIAPRYRLKKHTVECDAGAVYCNQSTGTSLPVYRLIDPSDTRIITNSRTDNWYRQEDIEQPEWFERVFDVGGEYYTQEEFDEIREYLEERKKGKPNAKG